MPLRSWLKSKVATQTINANEFWDSAVPPIGVIVKEETPQTTITNPYELYESMEEKDPELAGTLDDISALVVFYYNGLYLDIGEDRKLSNDEEALKKRIEQLERDFDFIDFFDAVTHGALKHGDMFIRKAGALKVDNGESRRVPAPQFLPRAYTSLSVKKQVMENPTQDFVQNPKYVAVNKYQLSGDNAWIGHEEVKWYRYVPMKKRSDGTWVPPEVLHFSMRKDGVIVEDQYGVRNMNCISKSPLKPLELTVKYKRHAILFDMVWQEANVPFLHYKMDLSAFDPTRFPGETQLDKIAAAEAAATTKMEGFRDKIYKRARDQGLITPSTTEIVSAGPNQQRDNSGVTESVSYINNSISSRMGALQRVRSGSGGSYAADLLLSSVTEPRLRVVAFKFFKIMENYVREFLSKEFDNEDLLSNIKIRKNLILPHERLDRAREALFKSQAKAYPIDDIRKTTGELPLSDEERKTLKEEFKMFQPPKPFGQSDKSAGDVAGDSKRGGRSADDEDRTPHTDRSGNK